MSSRLAASSSALAIVGLGCRFPGASTPDEFWRVLMSGRTRLGSAPPSRIAVYSAPAREGNNVPWLGAFLEDVHGFDCDYFEISPREAYALDPQQRLILQAAAMSLEDAAIGRRALRQREIGVFTGVSTHDHSVLTWGMAESPGRYAIAGTANGLTANRISYWLGATGPSVAVDTACSSALVALHYARLSLLSGECDLALCAASSVMLMPEVTASLQAAGVVSSSGTCRPFAAGADGYLRGEGAGAVLLCKLEDAIQRGYRVYAVLRGSAVNHNGSSNGLTAPNPQSQVQVIARAHAAAGTSPGMCIYVEAMAAAQELADTMELKALDATVGKGRVGDRPCLVGSLKGHIGHLEAASGIAGLIKSALALHHGLVPPTIGTDQPNPYLLRSDTRLSLVTEVMPLGLGLNDVMGVSAFGFGGANAHAVLAAAPQCDSSAATSDTPTVASRRAILTLSAYTAAGVRRLVAMYGTYLRSTSDAVDELCYTSNVSRTDWPMRAAVTGSTREELASRLEQINLDQTATPREPVPVALVFGMFGDTELHELHKTLRELPADLRNLTGAFAGNDAPLGEAICSVNAGADLSWPVALGWMWRRWVPSVRHLSAYGTGVYAAAVHAGVFDLAMARNLWKLHFSPDRKGAATEHTRISARRLIDIGESRLGPIGGPPELLDPRFWREVALMSLADLEKVELPPPLDVPRIVVGDLGSRTGEGSAEPIVDTLVRLYVQNADVRWNEVHRYSCCRRVALPFYPFEKSVGMSDSLAALGVRQGRDGLTATAVTGAGVQENSRRLLVDRLEELLERLGF